MINHYAYTFSQIHKLTEILSICLSRVLSISLSLSLSTLLLFFSLLGMFFFPGATRCNTAPNPNKNPGADAIP